MASLLFATMSSLVKISAAEVGTFEIVFYRSLIGLAFISTVMFIQGQTPHTKYLFGHIKRSVLGTLAFTIWFFTMGHLPLGTAVTLNYTAPLFIAATFVVTALMHHQKAPWSLAAAICVGFIGVCLILQPSIASDELPYALLGLFAGALGPFIFFQIAQLGRLREPSLRIVFYFSLVGTIWGLVGCYILEGGLKMHGMDVWQGLLGVGITAVLAQVAMTRAFAYGNMMLRHHGSARTGGHDARLRLRQYDADGVLSVCRHSFCGNHQCGLFQRSASACGFGRNAFDFGRRLHSKRHHQTTAPSRRQIRETHTSDIGREFFHCCEDFSVCASFRSCSAAYAPV